MNPRGIDISDQNSPIDIASLPADIAFVAIKATEGITFQDTAFQGYYHALKNDRPEIIRIPYHFFRWQDDSIAQGDNLLSCGVDFTEPGTAPLMLDLESNGTDVDVWMAQNLHLCLARVQEFVDYIFQKTSRQCIIYSFDSFIKENLAGRTWPNNPYWVSSFQSTPPPLIPGWPYSFWQYSQYGQVDGTTTGGNLDLDWYIGTQDALNALANITSQA